MGSGPRQFGLATILTYELFFHSTHMKGPEPTIGGLFWKPFAAASGVTFDQTCSGTIGTQWRSMSGFGCEQVNSTV